MASPMGTKRQLTMAAVMERRNVRTRPETILPTPPSQQSANSTAVLISDEETDVDSDSDELEDDSDDWIEAGIEELSNNEFEPTEKWDSNKPTEAVSESSNDANSLLVSNTGSTSSNCDARC